MRDWTWGWCLHPLVELSWEQVCLPWQFFPFSPVWASDSGIAWIEARIRFELSRVLSVGASLTETVPWLLFPFSPDGFVS